MLSISLPCVEKPFWGFPLFFCKLHAPTFWLGRFLFPCHSFCKFIKGTFFLQSTQNIPRRKYFLLDFSTKSYYYKYEIVRKDWIMNEVRRINLLHSEIGNVFHEMSMQLGLSDSVSSILYTICNFGDSCLLGDIVSMTGIPKQTVNSALRKMEGEGILHVETADGRRKRVVLTENGKLLALRTVGQMIRMENEIYTSWTEEERQMHLTLTQRYLEQLKEKAKELRK